jgi:hypothetical protein
VKRSLSSWGSVYEQGVLENELIYGVTVQIKEDVERIDETIKKQMCSLGKPVKGGKVLRGVGEDRRIPQIWIFKETL